MGKSISFNLLLTVLLLNLVACSKEDIGPDIDRKGQGPIPGGDYYVATWGNDTNSGSFDYPWLTWEKAFATADAGDTVYFRGGVYYVSWSNRSGATHNPSDNKGHNGTEENPVCFFNYPDEEPVLDGSLRSPTSWNTGLLMQGSDHLHLRGLSIRNFVQVVDYAQAGGIAANPCSNLIFENITVSQIGGAGIFFMSGFGDPGFEGITHDSTYFINCDVYDNCDYLSSGTAGAGGKADGIWAGIGPGAYICIEGCRSWNNSDDGFDIAGDGYADIRNNWAFKNGGVQGDGNGFKFGSPTHAENVDGIKRTLTNNLAAFNKSYAFNENYQGVCKGNYRVYNNTAYNHYISFGAQSGFDNSYPGTNLYRNNLSYVVSYNQVWSEGHFAFPSGYYHDHNSWDITIKNNPLVVSDSDFVSMNSDELELPRNDDGSLPFVNFLRLTKGSVLKDAGIEVGLSFKGIAPDLGAFESE